MNFSYMVIRAVREDWAYRRRDASNWHPRGRPAHMHLPLVTNLDPHRNQEVEEGGLQPVQLAENITFFMGVDASTVAENFAAEMASNYPQYDFFVVKSLAIYAAKPTDATKTTFTAEGVLPT